MNRAEQSVPRNEIQRRGVVHSRSPVSAAAFTAVCPKRPQPKAKAFLQTNLPSVREIPKFAQDILGGKTSPFFNKKNSENFKTLFGQHLTPFVEVPDQGEQDVGV